MRVLSVAFPAMQVGTGSGGGAEQILAMLDSGLLQQGHESIVIAAQGSRVAGYLIESPSPCGSPQDHREAIHLALAIHSVDLIHFHGLDFHYYLREAAVPMLGTLHLPVTWYPESIFDSRRSQNLTLNCVSHNQARSTPQSRSLTVIPNGVPTGRYAPGEPDDFLLWLGRVCPEKGAHIALEVARSLDVRLIIAGPVNNYLEHQKYFSEWIEPMLDHKRTYVGSVDFDQKRHLLSRARCLLVPSLVAETSSLVTMEALSSATPVVAFRAGALPEIIDDGATGFIVDSAEQMACAVSKIGHLSRAYCREQAISRFDAARMVESYLSVYRDITTRRFAVT